MNQVCLVGNLARDPELRTTQSGINSCSFTVAVQRRFANKDGVREADFISCVAWRQTADFVAKWFRKGSKIGVVGSLQTRSYQAQDGSKRFVVDVMVDNVEFVGGKNEGGEGHTQPTEQNNGNGFTEVYDDNLPF